MFCGDLSTGGGRIRTSDLPVMNGRWLPAKDMPRRTKLVDCGRLELLIRWVLIRPELLQQVKYYTSQIAVVDVVASNGVCAIN